MKKIFLPLVALCGLVAGLTLTSCGGGGGGEGTAGKTYQFKRDFAVMEIAFGNRMGDLQETPEGTEQYYNGFVSYKDESGSNDTSMTEQDEVTITVTQNDEGITIHVTGQSPTNLQENSVLAFLGLRIKDENGNEGQVDPQSSDYTIDLKLPSWPDKTPVTGKLVVTKLTVDEEDAEMDNNVEDDPDNPVVPVPLQSEVDITAERVL